MGGWRGDSDGRNFLLSDTGMALFEVQYHLQYHLQYQQKALYYKGFSMVILSETGIYKEFASGKKKVGEVVF